MEKDLSEVIVTGTVSGTNGVSNGSQIAPACKFLLEVNPKKGGAWRAS